MVDALLFLQVFKVCSKEERFEGELECTIYVFLCLGLSSSKRGKVIVNPCFDV